MILPNNVSTLRNIKDSYYYNGIEISKENFDIREFAKVCSKVNDIKYQLQQEKVLNNIRQQYSVIGFVNLTENGNIRLLCMTDKNHTYFGLYNMIENKVIPLTKNILKHITDQNIYLLSYNLNKTARLIQKGEIEKTTIKDSTILHIFENYIDTIEKSGNSFQYTYELEFINGYKEYILTDEQLKDSLVER